MDASRRLPGRRSNRLYDKRGGAASRAAVPLRRPKSRPFFACMHTIPAISDCVMRSCMKEPRPADPLTVEAAAAALDAARADLGQEEAKLGTARAALADTEREMERLADVMAGGAGDQLRRPVA